MSMRGQALAQLTSISILFVTIANFANLLVAQNQDWERLKIDAFAGWQTYRNQLVNSQVSGELWDEKFELYYAGETNTFVLKRYSGSALWWIAAIAGPNGDVFERDSEGNFMRSQFWTEAHPQNPETLSQFANEANKFRIPLLYLEHWPIDELIRNGTALVQEIRPVADDNDLMIIKIQLAPEILRYESTKDEPDVISVELEVNIEKLWTIRQYRYTLPDGTEILTEHKTVGFQGVPVRAKTIRTNRMSNGATLISKSSSEYRALRPDDFLEQRKKIMELVPSR